MPANFPVVELWEVLADRQPGRVTKEDVTVFDLVGFALEDFSALHVICDAAQEFNVGHHISLVTTPHNPKNLFGFVGEASGYVCSSDDPVVY